MKKRIFDIIQIGEKDDSASRIFDLFIVCVILVHIAVLFIATFDAAAAYMDGLHTIKMVTIIIFVVEYDFEEYGQRNTSIRIRQSQSRPAFYLFFRRDCGFVYNFAIPFPVWIYRIPPASGRPDISIISDQ